MRRERRRQTALEERLCAAAICLLVSGEYDWDAFFCFFSCHSFVCVSTSLTPVHSRNFESNPFDRTDITSLYGISAVVIPRSLVSDVGRFHLRLLDFRPNPAEIPRCGEILFSPLFWSNHEPSLNCMYIFSLCPLRASGAYQVLNVCQQVPIPATKVNH